MIVDLGLSDEQLALITSFGQLLAKESSPERVRAAEATGFDEGLWAKLTEIGVLTMGVPETHGGWGASLLDLTLIAEQLGRAVAPAPVIETQVTARLLSSVATEAALEQLGAALVGEQLVTLSLHPPVDGVARLVPGGSVCDHVVVLDGDRLSSRPASEATRQPVLNLASAPLADVRIDGEGGMDLGAGERAGGLFDEAVDEWLVLTAAALVGTASTALEIACEYVTERRAFGVPIGTFQAMSHPLADAATNLDGARLLMRKAAWSLDTGASRARELAAMAFAFASRTAAATTYTALHAHGGFGFMLEYDVQLHYRRARGWGRVWGDAEAADRRAADARYGATTSTTVAH